MRREPKNQPRPEPTETEVLRIAEPRLPKVSDEQWKKYLSDIKKNIVLGYNNPLFGVHRPGVVTCSSRLRNR